MALSWDGNSTRARVGSNPSFENVSTATVVPQNPCYEVSDRSAADAVDDLMGELDQIAELSRISDWDGSHVAGSVASAPISEKAAGKRVEKRQKTIEVNWEDRYEKGQGEKRMQSKISSIMNYENGLPIFPFLSQGQSAAAVVGGPQTLEIDDGMEEYPLHIEGDRQDGSGAGRN